MAVRVLDFQRGQINTNTDTFVSEAAHPHPAAERNLPDDAGSLLPWCERRSTLCSFDLCRHISGCAGIQVAAQREPTVVSSWTEGIPTYWERP